MLLNAKRLAIGFCCILQLWASPLVDELDPPDEQSYSEYILSKWFTPLAINTADSSQLSAVGFTVQAIALILDWQHSGASRAGYKQLLPELSDQDAERLEQYGLDPPVGRQINFRQRGQYRQTQSGWRLLNKGRIRGAWGELVLLTEADPGERRLTDHAVFAWLPRHVPGLQRLLIGDYHVRLAAGLLINQSGSRLGVSPGNLNHRLELKLVPHFSTRETGFYHGLAATWQRKDLRGVGFISRRSRQGHFVAGNFQEAVNGIHVPGSSLTTAVEAKEGVSLMGTLGSLELFAAVISDSFQLHSSRWSWGGQLQFGDHQSAQLEYQPTRNGPDNALVAWNYNSPTIRLAAQLRSLQNLPLTNPGEVAVLLGTRVLREESFSFRLQIIPHTRMRGRYALDIGRVAARQSMADLQMIWRSRLQFNLRHQRQSWQLDWSRQQRGPVIPADHWSGQAGWSRLTKAAIALEVQRSPTLKFRVNLKTALNQSGLALLAQQRLKAVLPSWEWAVGYSRYQVPAAELRLSIYEQGLQESYSFFTAFGDGQRWSLYVQHALKSGVILELSLAHTRRFDQPGEVVEYPDAGLQLSVVL